MKHDVIFIDNFDSFTYNLVDELQVLGNKVTVYRNDTDPDKIMGLLQQIKDEGGSPVLVLSPGPASPDDANNLIPIIKKAMGHYPMLGICLGHQALGQVLGGRVERASVIVHGKSSDIEHCGAGAFANLPNPLKVARYHSLVVTNLPENVEITASFDGMCMAMHQKALRITGFQFHPESIMTAFGRKLLEQALDEIAG